MPLRFARPVVLLASLLTLAACGGEATAPVVAASLTLSPNADTLLALGATRQYAAVVRDAKGNVLTGRAIRWSSTAEAVAAIDSNGVATAVAPGSTGIRATVDGITATASLSVVQAVANVTVTPGLDTLDAIGASVQYSAVAHDANNNAIPGAKVLWLSSDQAVATVDTLGRVTSHKSGTATISAAVGGVPGNAGIVVRQIAAKLGFRIQPPSTVMAGDPFPAAVQVEVQDAAGARVVDADIAITLAASNGTLHGTTTVQTVNGVSSFSGLWLELAAANNAISATGGGLQAATSTAVTVTHAVPAKIVLGTPAASNGALAALHGTVYDRFGNVTTSLAHPVVLRASGGVWGAQLSGQTSAVPVNGTFTFDSARITKPEYAVSVTATVDSVSATSTSFASRVAFTSLSLGRYTSCGTTNGPLFCWGGDVTQEMGNGAGGPDSVPNMVVDGRAYSAVGVSIDQACGLSGGIAYCWGRGDGVPVAVSSPVAFQSIAVGVNHACALTAAGAAYCWGADNSWGQLGDSLPDAHPDAKPVVGGHAFSVITAGNVHTCGLEANGKAWCWGAGTSGQLGDSSASSSNFPVAVAGGYTFVAVAAGATQTCAVDTFGWAYCWGGLQSTPPDNVHTNASHDGTAFVAMSAASDRTCGLTQAGSLECWNGIQPVPAPVMSGVSQIAASESIACGKRTADNRWVCVGTNAYGQIGDGTMTQRTTPSTILVQP